MEVSDNLTPRPLYPQNKTPITGALLVGRWVAPRAGLDAIVKEVHHCPCWVLNCGRPARNLVFYSLGAEIVLSLSSCYCLHFIVFGKVRGKVVRVL